MVRPCHQLLNLGILTGFPKSLPRSPLDPFFLLSVVTSLCWTGFNSKLNRHSHEKQQSLWTRLLDKGPSHLVSPTKSWKLASLTSVMAAHEAQATESRGRRPAMASLQPQSETCSCRSRTATPDPLRDGHQRYRNCTCFFCKKH